VKQSKQSARRRIVKTKVAKKTFRATVGPFILAERLRAAAGNFTAGLGAGRTGAQPREIRDDGIMNRLFALLQLDHTFRNDVLANPGTFAIKDI